MTDVRRFPSTLAAVAAARRFARDSLAEASDEVVDQVVMMVSELATNCVRHAGTEFQIAIDCQPDQIFVEVTDGGAGAPAVRSPGPTEPSGRGLLIVEQLSHEWGVREPESDVGKTVWFTFRVPSVDVTSRSLTQLRSTAPRN